MLHLPTYDETRERDLRSHLRLLHGIYVNDEKDAHRLVECHNEDHVHQFGLTQIRHDHDPGFEDDHLEEWAW